MTAPTLKLVLHVDQTDRWPAALGNVENLIRDYPNAAVRVVANGTAVYPFAGSNDLTKRITEYAGRGVTFQLCANSLRSHAVTRGPVGPLGRIHRARPDFFYERRHDRDHPPAYQRCARTLSAVRGRPRRCDGTDRRSGARTGLL